MQKQYLLYILLTGFSIAFFACEGTSTAEELLSDTDKSFLLDAADHGLFQINAGQAASTNGDVANINAFGQTMISRYTTWNQELQALAADKKIQITNTLNDERQEKLDSLSARRGIAFDTIYIRMMVQTHNTAVNLFESAPNSVEDSELKNWAVSKIAQLRDDLNQAKTLQDSISNAPLRRQ